MNSSLLYADESTTPRSSLLATSDFMPNLSGQINAAAVRKLPLRKLISGLEWLFLINSHFIFHFAYTVNVTGQIRDLLLLGGASGHTAYRHNAVPCLDFRVDCAG